MVLFKPQFDMYGGKTVCVCVCVCAYKYIQDSFLGIAYTINGNYGGNLFTIFKQLLVNCTINKRNIT